MTQHPVEPDVSFDGGDLDCGNGLLLLIRKHIDPLQSGSLLEIRSREISVREDLPAWCRMTGNDLVHTMTLENEMRFLVCKGPWSKAAQAEPSSKNLNKERSAKTQSSEAKLPVTDRVQPPVDGQSVSRDARDRRAAMPLTQPIQPVSIPTSLPTAEPGRPIPQLAVMGIGSWPRPRWMLAAMHEHLEGRLSDADFQATADDAVRLVVQHQQAAGVDVFSDGEQRRDSYASFVGGRLDNCQLIPLIDLLPYVDDPDKFEREMRALDIPAKEVRHPAVFGPLGRSQAVALHEFAYLATLTPCPIKIALPGPYLLTRTMWMECISDRAYQSRENLARDIVRVLREELCDLLHAGVSLVQFDEPVLSEVAFAQPAGGRTFMCGALGERLPMDSELAFACQLLADLTDGLPLDRIALHVCRGNWSKDETVALSGGYAPLLDFLKRVPVGNLFLELCTPRAGEIEILQDLPHSTRIGVGVVNQKHQAIETLANVRGKIEQALRLFGESRVLLTPDCGFATFADNPIASTQIAIEKLAVITTARKQILGV